MRHLYLVHVLTALLASTGSLLSVLGIVPLPRDALDIADPAQLAQALQARQSAERGVIVFAFNDVYKLLHLNKLNKIYAPFWWLMTEQLILQLEKIGYTHYIAVADSPEVCAELHRRWKVPDLPPSCAFSSKPYRDPKHRSKNTDVWNLWAMRYYALTIIAERGVDVLLIDTDFEFNFDIYPVLMSPPLTEYTVVALKEEPVNGGTMFCRGSKAHKNGGSLWLLREVERRHTLMRDAEEATGRDPGLDHDQSILADALLVSMHAPNSSEWDWRRMYERSHAKDHPFWVEHPQDDARFGAPLRPGTVEWGFSLTADHHSIPNSTCPYTDPDNCRRLTFFLKRMKFLNKPLRYATLCVPHDSPYYDEGVPCERLVVGPPWLWSKGELAQYGWNVTGAVHLLHTYKYWQRDSPGSYAGRIAWLAVRGRIDPRLLPPPDEERVLLQKEDDEQWQASMGRNTSEESLRVLGALADRAIEEKKLLAVAPLPCHAAWLKRSSLAIGGILDRRVISNVDGTKCYPSPANFCLCHVHFMYDFMLGYRSVRGTTGGDGAAEMWLGMERTPVKEECMDFWVLDPDQGYNRPDIF